MFVQKTGRSKETTAGRVTTQLHKQAKGFPLQSNSSPDPMAAWLNGSARMVAQRKQMKRFCSPPAQLVEEEAAKPNQTGMPDTLKRGIESLSGASMDDVKVHYNSSAPARLNAHAYAQGRDIHVGPGQEQHLPHEAWHVVQQAQGRVKPTRQMHRGTAVNDDVSLESEADSMGAKAVSVGQRKAKDGSMAQAGPATRQGNTDAPVQKVGFAASSEKLKKQGGNLNEWNTQRLMELAAAMDLSTQRLNEYGAFADEQKKAGPKKQDPKKSDLLFNAYRAVLWQIDEKAKDWKELASIAFQQDAEYLPLRQLLDATLAQVNEEATMHAVEHSRRLQEQYAMTTAFEKLGDDFVVLDEPGESPWSQMVRSVPLPSVAKFKADAQLGFLAGKVGGMSRIVDALGNYHTTIAKVVDQKSTPVSDAVVCLYRLMEALNAEQDAWSEEPRKSATESLGEKADAALTLLEPAQMRGRRVMRRQLAAQDKAYGHVFDNKMQRADREGGFFGHLFGKKVADLLEGKEPAPVLSNEDDEINARVQERHGQFEQHANQVPKK